MADIYLIDDHAILRDGLRTLLEHSGHRVIGEADQPTPALADLVRLRPPIVLLDVYLDHRSGFEVLEQLQRRDLPCRVIMTTMSAEPRHVAEALRLGAFGYVLKDSAAKELLGAIEAVASGRKYLCKRAAELAVEGLLQDHSATTVHTLSPRDRQVVLMVVRGQTSAAIAAEMNLTPMTVASYRSRLMLKLGVKNLPELVRLAVREGLIGAED